MSENQKFKLKYDELREGNPAKSNSKVESASDEKDDQFYEKVGNARNLCFEWPNGKR